MAELPHLSIHNDAPIADTTHMTAEVDGVSVMTVHELFPDTAPRVRRSHIFARHANDHYVEPAWCSARLFDVEDFEGAIISEAVVPLRAHEVENLRLLPEIQDSGGVA